MLMAGCEKTNQCFLSVFSVFSHSCFSDFGSFKNPRKKSNNVRREKKTYCAWTNSFSKLTNSRLILIQYPDIYIIYIYIPHMVEFSVCLKSLQITTLNKSFVSSSLVCDLWASGTIALNWSMVLLRKSPLPAPPQ